MPVGIISEFYYFCNLTTSTRMKYSESRHQQEGYVSPSMRFIDLKLDQSFLASNLEPIGGGDDPDIDW